MTVTRRAFLRAGVSASAAALTATPRWLPAMDGAALPQPVEVPITDASVRELALRAVEAARATGASYTDVRLTHTRGLHFQRKPSPLRFAASETAWLDTGVRALVDGTWGFAAGTVWTPDEVVRLARAAVHQAKANALGRRLVVELGHVPVIKEGHWTHPVERDPFVVPDGEIRDFLDSFYVYALRKLPGAGVGLSLAFRGQDKAFASSEGSYCTQRLYRTAGEFGVSFGGKGLSSPIIAGASLGWEYIRQAPLREEIHRLIEELKEDFALPARPVEVGRYDVAFDAASMAELLGKTIGAATELDRALGYEANAGGTSYLNDPFGMLGSYQAGAPLLTVTADRTTPTGCATVKWDDDGVEPDQFTLVKDGVLVDFQTHRESTGWFPASAGPARRSHGCAAAPRAFEAPLIHTPNLRLEPGAEALGFEGLVSQMRKGIAIKDFGVNMDFQCLNGFGTTRRDFGGVYEVKDGKRIARITGAEFIVRAPELWRGLVALGGPVSQRPFALQRTKGEPAQETWHTAWTVPGLVKQVATIRKGDR